MTSDEVARARHRLGAEHLRLCYDDRVIVDDLSVDIPMGRITSIVGPNACGKSTLLRALARLLAPRAGCVMLDGRAIHRMPTREVAKALGVLPQTPIAPDGIRVVDLVARGRHPHLSWLGRWSAADEHAVLDAMRATGVVELAEHDVDQLSGGQRQRVWIAMALAQQTQILLLDEPTTYLDLAHQIELLDLLADLNADDDRTIVLVLHDLNLAARYSDHLLREMRHGELVVCGSPSAVIDEEFVERVFDLPCCVIEDPITATPLVVPLSRRTRTSHAPGTSTP